MQIVSEHCPDHRDVAGEWVCECGDLYAACEAEEVPV